MKKLWHAMDANGDVMTDGYNVPVMALDELVNRGYYPSELEQAGVTICLLIENEKSWEFCEQERAISDFCAYHI